VKQETPTPIYKIALPRHIPPGAEKPFSEADMADKVKKGFYLVTIGHCMECHTPMGPRGREFESAYGKGGFEFPGPWGKSVSRNITSPQGKRHRRLERCRDQARDHPRGEQGRLAPEAADGLRVYANMTDGDLDAVVGICAPCRRRSDSVGMSGAKPPLSSRRGPTGPATAGPMTGSGRDRDP